MARYFFDIKNGHRLVDPAGLGTITRRLRGQGDRLPDSAGHGR
jgi:hypothetical protein